MAPPLPCSPPIRLPMPLIQPRTPQFILLDNLYRRPKIPDQQPPSQPQLTIETQLKLALGVPFTNYCSFEKMNTDEEIKSLLSLHRNEFWRPSGTIDNVWYTSLVIKYLRQELSDFKEECIGVENNAMKWLLSQLCEGQTLEMLLEEAVYPTEYEW
ncbi:unnamed protein product [Mytilus edulis]|uniref:Uncharacterized protein n=1 Tax=Mytilus edulis TaxID=6550 RepID=A0A8S3Q409_MYTED|nr:unnamed protein product [Mytilus edulis]